MIDKSYIETLFFQSEEHSNSLPIKFTCSNDKPYFIKIAHSTKDFDDLIYEVVAVHLARHFGIPVPDYDFIRINRESYILGRNIQYNQNKKFIVINPIGFGSKIIEHHKILTPNNRLKDKHDFNSISNPLDYIRIGLFDFHLSNMDRSNENFNLIYDITTEPGKRKIIAIDHTAIFGGTINKNRFTPRLNNNLVSNILSCTLGEQIIKYLNQDRRKDLFQNIIEYYFERTNNIPEVIEACFETIPKEWRYNKELPQRMINYLVNEKRNVSLQEEISKFFGTFGINIRL